jgi:hypothetical protein
MNGTAAPTVKQLAYLRRLACRPGQSFATPQTRAQASTEIRRLQQIRTTGFTFAELQAEQAARDAHQDAPLVRAHEITGYGANCTWSRAS